MTAKRIIEVETEYFASFGYNGTSFTLIADTVGIKKQSIYAHFQSKEHLYFECLANAMVIEQQRGQRVHATLVMSESVDDAKRILYQYLLECGNQQSFLFLYQMAMNAPEQYRLQQQKYREQHRQIMIDAVRLPVLKWKQLKRVDRDKEIFHMLSCLIDGCVVERLIYGKVAFERRFAVIWPILWGSIVQ